MKVPLAGIRVVEFAGIGPAPFASMLLADFGADVLRIDRPDSNNAPEVTGRGRSSLILDLKNPECVAKCLDIIDRADVLIEGFRPGVMERLGLGPAVALRRNPRLIYGRITGWGQTGPLASMAGHDVNFIALAGALDATGTAEIPVPPLNMLGDYGGGALYLVYGIMVALFERTNSGLGQVIDSAIVDGVASLMTLFHDPIFAGISSHRRENILSGRAPFYGVYRCADGKFISFGAIEPQFFAKMLEILELPSSDLGNPADPNDWRKGRRLIARSVARRTRDEWCTLMEGQDACFAPVLTMSEAIQNAHMKAREAFVTADGVTYPAPAPRLSRTPARLRTNLMQPGNGGAETLSQWGVTWRK